MTQPDSKRLVTYAAGDARYPSQWKPSTDYAAGQAVINPSGDLVTSLAAHTSGTTFNSANWNLSHTFASQGDALAYSIVFGGN
jgi:hypothetical protein